MEKPDQNLYTLIQSISEAINALQQTLAQLLPTAGATVVATATAGTDGAPPAQVAGYLTVTVAGAPYKLPLYKV